MLLNADLNLCLCDFGGSKNNKYNGEDLSDFGFFDSRLDSFDVTTNIEIFGLNSSMYIILAGHLSYGSSIIITAKKRLNYVYNFERLAFKSILPDTSGFIDNDIIENC